MHRYSAAIFMLLSGANAISLKQKDQAPAKLLRLSSMTKSA